MKKLNQDNFINRCNVIFNNKYDYTNLYYKNIRSKISVICKIHGEFIISATNHLHNKQGCSKCALDDHKLTKLTENRLNNLKIIHNNKYEYKNLTVDSGFITITCPKHGDFKQYLYFHEYGHGCSECNSSSRGEDIIKNFLINNNIEYLRNYKFEDCKRTKHLKFDFFLPNYNICIEYDGEHHFKDNKYFGIGNLKYIQENDRIKNEYCLNNNIEIIRIHYLDIKKIYDILSLRLVY